MTSQIEIVTPGPNGTLLDEKGSVVTPPIGWEFLPAGDAGITRKATLHKTFWRLQVQMGKRKISKGIWAPKALIDAAKQEMEATRQTAEFQKKATAAKLRSEKKQLEYVDDFYGEVFRFLNFHPRYRQEAERMAYLICEHATPVGSGTVARTLRIPIEERAARAVIAWMRHQTTGYDNMQIARIKGERRKVRQLLAQRSVELLKMYRNGEPLLPNCPLRQALR